MSAVYDKSGREIMVGDTLKVFHFIGPRRRRFYMYKYVLRKWGRKLVVSHLDPELNTYYLILDGRHLPDYEIVQGYAGVKPGETHLDRPKHKPEDNNG